MRFFGRRLHLKYPKRHDTEAGLDSVRELTTEFLLPDYPKQLKALTLCLTSIPEAPDFLQDIPTSIHWLSLTIPSNRWPYSTIPSFIDRTNVDHPDYIKDIPRLKRLKKLKLCFARLLNGDLLRLVRLAIQNDMSYLSVTNNILLPTGSYHRTRSVELVSQGVQKCNIDRRSRLSQVMAVHRTKHLRLMSTPFKVELLNRLDPTQMEAINTASMHFD